MITIHKYPLSVDEEQVIEMPEGAMILCAEYQYGTPTLWARVDTDKPLERVTIRVVGTGVTIHDAEQLSYVATLIGERSPFVWHVFRKNAT